MKLNIEELLAAGVPPHVIEWMDTYGTNHKLLLDTWGSEDDEKAVYGRDLDLLYHCLAYELQKTHPKPAIVNRLRGRFTRLRGIVEVEEVAEYLAGGAKTKETPSWI